MTLHDTRLIAVLSRSFAHTHTLRGAQKAYEKSKSSIFLVFGSILLNL